MCFLQSSLYSCYGMRPLVAPQISAWFCRIPCAKASQLKKHSLRLCSVSRYMEKATAADMLGQIHSSYVKWQCHSNCNAGRYPSNCTVANAAAVVLLRPATAVVALLANATASVLLRPAKTAVAVAVGQCHRNSVPLVSCRANCQEVH